MLGRKQSVRNNEDWKNALDHIEETVSKKELDSLVKKTVKDIKEKCKGKKAAYAWSAGKDSLVLGEICEKAGIDQSVLVRCNLEYPAFIAWIEQNKPSNLEIINTGQDMEWLKKHQDMLFPDKSNKAAQWFHIVQHRGQARYYKEHQLDQDFLPRTTVSGITMVGIRTAESVQRLQNIASMTKAGNRMTSKKQVFPIYDWTDNDVWLFLLRNYVDIPEIYLFLWQSGSSKRQMRVSQFFSVDTARSLVKMNEYYPDLMERVIRREPNAYLAALYWDSEMFGRSSRKRKESEQGQEQKDYKQELINLFDHMEIFDTPHKRHVAERYRNFFIAVSAIATPEDCKHIYEGLISGDPKMRTFRALYQRIYGRYINNAKKERKHG